MTITIQGDLNLYNSFISIKAMLKAFKGEGEAVLLELSSLISTEQSHHELVVPEPIT